VFQVVWSPVLVLAFMLALDPLRLGLLILLITRPRPLHSLLFYWVGAMTASVPCMLVPLTVLHVTPGFRSVAQHLASQVILGSPTVRHVQLGMGVVALLIAVLMAVRLRAGQHAYVAAPADTRSSLVADSNTPTAISQPVDRSPDAPAKGRSPIRRPGARAFGAYQRLWFRAVGTWETESPKPALIVGLLSGPPPLTVLLVLTTIMASQAAIGTQVSLAFAWVVGMFAVIEIILVSYLASPTKTETALRLLHDWVLAHRRQVLIAMIAVVGVVSLAYGMGITQVGG
jgi:Sap, sulfolipid-1-addressing protein